MVRMSAPQIAAWLAGLGIRVGAKYVRSRGSQLARHLYKNKKGLLGGAVAAGGANIVTSSKRLPNSEGVKRYYRVTKKPPLKPRHPRKALNPKRITSASFDTVDPVAAKKKRPTLSVGSYGGRFKKRRRSKRVTRPTQGNKDTVYGVMSGSGAVYHGWSTCGGRDYAIKQFSEQLLKQVCYERKVDIRGRDQALEWNTGGANRIDKLQLLHRLVAGDGTVYEGLEDVTLVTTLGGHTSASFDTVVINLETKLKLILDTEGRYIYGYKLHETNSAAASAPPPVVRLQLDTWKFNMNVNVSYKVQNITPADDATGTKDDDMGYSKDSILANPLRGRTYEFSPGYPRVRPAVLTQASALQIVSKETAPHGFVTFPTGGNAIYGAGMPMHAPPPGGTLFQNCIKGSAVNIQPGNFKIMYSNFKFSGSVKQFCSKVTSATNSVTGKLSRFTLGNTVAYGLMPTMRTHGETIKIAYQYDCTSTSTLRPKYKCTIPRNNASTHLDFIAT